MMNKEDENKEKEEERKGKGEGRRNTKGEENKMKGG